MSISASLLAKAVGGVAAISIPVTTSVYYKDSIYGLFVSEEEPTKQIPDKVTVDEEEMKEWKLEKEEENIKITYSGGACQITQTGSGNDIETQLKGKLGESDASTEDQKRYRRAILKKCKLSSSSINYDKSKNLSELFDQLTDEELNSEEKSLTSQEWQFSSSVEDNKIKTTVTISSGDNQQISVGVCKIIGSQKSESGTTNLDNSKGEIENSIKTRIEENNTENKQKFLTKCKRSFDNEINLSLIAKPGETNKYELENLSSIFEISS